jgi:low temperature requirement protein LtrA
VVIGGLLRIHDPSGHNIMAFGAAFAGAVALWWLYFDRAAEDSAHAIDESDDPGRLARNAFHWIHPLIVGGIIVTAAADARVLDHPTARGDATAGWLVLGGTALFLAGHALFKAVVWRTVSWPRVGGVVALAGLGLLVPHTAALTLSICAVAVVVAVAIADRLLHVTRVA